jgi:hypothetical protein
LLSIATDTVSTVTTAVKAPRPKAIKAKWRRHKSTGPLRRSARLAANKLEGPLRQSPRLAALVMAFSWFCTTYFTYSTYSNWFGSILFGPPPTSSYGLTVFYSCHSRPHRSIFPLGRCQGNPATSERIGILYLWKLPFMFAHYIETIILGDPNCLLLYSTQLHKYKSRLRPVCFLCYKHEKWRQYFPWVRPQCESWNLLPHSIECKPEWIGSQL